MFSSASTGQGSSQLAEFACARCWKQKKKCDKVSPQCARCAALATTCVYSLQPPKQSVFVYASLDTEERTELPQTSLQHGMSNSQEAVNPECTSAAKGDLHLDAREAMHGGSNDSFTYQVSTLLFANGINIEAICKRYFQTFHKWLSFINEEGFWSYFLSSPSHTDPAFSALLLSIYLIASDPVQDNISGEFIESVYSAAKQVWLPLQNTRRPSIVLIQASLLLATFENGQALEETSRLTMSACISMAYAMRLDVSIKRKALLDLNARDDLNTRRCMWWAIVILERLLFAKNLAAKLPFESLHPTLDDYLPPSPDTIFRGASGSEPLGVYTDIDSVCSEIIFADVGPYPALAQATYLFNRVSDHIKNHTPVAHAQREIDFLDKTLQTFARSLLRQADGQSLNGNYCPAFFTTIISLVSLHRYDLSCGDSALQKLPVNSECRAWLAINTFTRLFRDIAKKHLKTTGVPPRMQPYEIYVVYLGATLHIEVGDRSNEVAWQDDLQQMIMGLQVVQHKWKIAKVYLGMIEDMLRCEENTDFSSAIQTTSSAQNSYTQVEL